MGSNLGAYVKNLGARLKITPLDMTHTYLCTSHGYGYDVLVRYHCGTVYSYAYHHLVELYADMTYGRCVRQPYNHAYILERDL